ncbi:lipopolysaccharide biosynthesis protein [Halobium palmae]|uniref:Lipopolysaccharide biosynthesis protein n=1 Tax=Halobium palmae TaxID=1776492 RepID=A0ABD5RY55_9EURY
MFDDLIASVRSALRTLRPSGSLTAQTVKSGIWSVGANVGTRALQTVTTVVLAAILGPQEFGLMGYTLLTYSGLRRFSRLGIDRALVHHPTENVDEYMDTAFAIQLLRGAVLAVALYLSAPLFASFFTEPRITPLLRVIAVSPLLVALYNPNIVYFEKNLDIHKKFVFDMSGAGVRFVVTVGLALTLGNVWALVFGYIAADAVRLVVSYWLHSYRPRLSVDMEQVRELVGYGKWITATSAVGFLLLSGDDAVVGWLLSTAALGYYQLGYRLGKTPTMEVSRSLSTVAFPVYSRLQDDSRALADAMNRTVRMLSFVSFPAAVGIVITAPAFVPGVLGSQWLPSVVVMQLAAVYGAFSALTSAFNDLWNAIGRPDYTTKINVLRLLVTGVLIYPATTEFGIRGAVAVMAGVFVVLIVPVKFYVAVESVEADYRAVLMNVLYPATTSAVMAAALLGVQRAVEFGSPVVEFVCLVPVGILVYLGATIGVEAHSAWGIRNDLRAAISAVRG